MTFDVSCQPIADYATVTRGPDSTSVKLVARRGEMASANWRHGNHGKYYASTEFLRLAVAGEVNPLTVRTPWKLP